MFTIGVVLCTAPNGTSFRSTDFLPQVGFSDRLMHLIDPQRREQESLPKLDPTAELACSSQVNWNHPDTERAQFSATLSTTADQTILISGEKVREWTEGNRHYAQYQWQ